MPASSETGTNSKPLALSASISLGSASTVFDLSPPESCSRMMCPLPSGLGSVASTMERSTVSSADGGCPCVGALDDLVSGWALPIVGIDMKSHRDIAHALRDPNGNDLFGSRGFGVTEKR